MQEQQLNEVLIEPVGGVKTFMIPFEGYFTDGPNREFDLTGKSPLRVMSKQLGSRRK